MTFPFHIDILDLTLKGMLIGILASAPMGPVGILCVQRTLNKGRWYGFVTGVGATASDIFYALITGYGMSFIMDLINNPKNLFVLKIIGSIMLMIFGVYCFLSKPKERKHNSHKGNENGCTKTFNSQQKIPKKKGTFIHNGVTGFFVTVSNPLIILLFVAAFAQFTFVVPDKSLVMSAGYLGIIIGALLWWFGLTWLIDNIRGKFTSDGIIIINKVIGSIVIIFSLIVFIGTVFNLYTFEY